MGIVFIFSLLAWLLVFCEYSLAFGVTPPPTTRQQAAIKATHTMRSSATKMSSKADSTSIDIQEEPIQLSSGVTMNVLWSPAPKETTLPPLIFLHGSFHGAWCWTEKFFPYFHSLGYPVAAVNWRGTGGTFAGEGVKKVKMEEHVQDLKAFLEEFVPPKFSGKKPVLISHSFGGLSIMKYLEEYPQQGLDSIGGAAIMCSVPPSGNGRMTMRFLRRSLRDSWKITKGLAMKKVINDQNLCRELFFGGLEDDHDVSESDVVRYQGYFDRDSEATIDLMDLAKKLPSAQIDDNGRALFLSPTSPSPPPPFLVVGATEDFIVDKEGNQETALYFGLNTPVVVDSPHDVMLGKKWKTAATAVQEWLQESVLSQ